MKKVYKSKSLIREYTEAIGVAIVLAMIIRTFIFQAFKIPSGSMIPTLLEGDHILVNKFIYTMGDTSLGKYSPFRSPKRGDVVVFKYPIEPDKDFIKRVVGLPGDKIDLKKIEIPEKGSSNKRKQDVLFINGNPVSLTYIGPYKYSCSSSLGKDNPINLECEKYLENLDGVEHDIIYIHSLDDNLGNRRKGTLPLTVPEGHLFVMGDNRDNSHDSRYWGFVPMEDLKGIATVIYFSNGVKDKYHQLSRIGNLIR